MIKRSHWLRLSILCTSGLLILVISPIAVELLLKLYSEHVARYVQRSATVSHTDSDFVSMCGGNADDRGPHQKVIAYSLYGNFSMKTVLDRYFNPFKVTIDAVHQYFPDWIIRIYHNVTLGDSNWDLLKNIYSSRDYVDLCNVTEIASRRKMGKMFAMTWRFFPLLDEMVDIFMSRDTDGAVLYREVEAVNEWLDTDKTFHIMRDYPSHCRPMLGGLWGAKLFRNRNNITQRAEMMFKLNHSHTYDYDQDLLKELMWPIAKRDAVAHDSFCCEKFPSSQPFPSPRIGGSFVGMVDELSGEYNMPECPLQCRADITQDWIFC